MVSRAIVGPRVGDASSRVVHFIFAKSVLRSYEAPSLTEIAGPWGWPDDGRAAAPLLTGQDA